MLENLISPELLAKKEGISLEEAKAALNMSSQLTDDLNQTMAESLDGSKSSDETSANISNLVSGFVANLTGKTPAELSQAAKEKQATEGIGSTKPAEITEVVETTEVTEPKEGASEQ